jgi:hypothetical protein
MELLDDD